jgi:hypothetical protein
MYVINSNGAWAHSSMMISGARGGLMTPSSVLSTPTGADSADHYNVRGGNVDALHTPLHCMLCY